MRKVNNEEILLAKKELAERELAQREFLSFVKYDFPEYRINWHHQLMADKLQAVQEGKIKRLIISCPPRSGKSELVSKYFPAYCIGKNKNDTIIQVSYSGDLAIDFGRQVRNIVASQNFENIFPGTKLAEDSKSKGKWNTNGRGAYSAVGVGGALTGKGARILIIDDPIKNREEAESKLIRENVWNFYTSTARTRLTPDGAIIVVMTRWHQDDLAGKLIEQDGKSWEIINLPAVAENDEEWFVPSWNKNYLRTTGEALWKDYFTKEVLDGIRADIGPYDWQSLYQQNPISGATQEFTPEMFQYVDRPPDRNECDIYITFDTAVSQKTTGDYTAATINHVNEHNIWHIDSRRSRSSPQEVVKMLFELNEKYQPVAIGIEKTIYFDVILPFLRAEMMKRNVWLNIVPLKHNQQRKELRIRSLLPRYNNNGIKHVKGRTTDLEEELLQFPKGKHDDSADSLAYQSQIAKAFVADRKILYNIEMEIDDRTGYPII